MNDEAITTPAEESVHRAMAIQLKRLREFKARHKDESGPMLARLQQAVIANQNVFEVLVNAVRCCSLGQITNTLFEVGGSTGGVRSCAAALLDAWET